MGIGDSIMVVSCLAGLMFALPGLLVFLNLAFFGTSNRAVMRLTHGGYTPFFAGFLPLIVIGIPGAILASIGSVPQFIGGVMLLFLLAWGFMGLGVVARLVGIRVTQMNERSESPLVQTLAGAFMLSFAIAFPVVGWVVVLPVTLIVGMGAITLVSFGRIGRVFGFGRQPQRVQTPVYSQEISG